jgi:4-amino-4-deoxy-L-arabinose transferase-like glycosyltransferase
MGTASGSGGAHAPDGGDGAPAIDLTAPPWRWIVAAVVVVCALLYATLSRYGYHRDELYFRMLPPRLGYVDQPFLTPLLAKVSIRLFGDTVFGMRALAPLFTAAGVVLAALSARELGGNRRAQGLAAWGYASTALPLLGGHYFVTGTIDLALWAAALLAVTRALLRDARWWLAAGAVLGVAADNKLLVVILVLSLAVGILGLGPRSVLRSRHLWTGVVIALLLAAPTLVYQATHDFPQLAMARALHDNNAGDVRAQLIPYQVLLIGPPLFVFVVIGFVALWQRPAWRPVRGLALAAVVALALTFLAGGQIYYAFGLLAFLLAAGWATDRGATWLLVAAVALNGAVNAFIALPLLPLSHVSVQAALNPTIGDQIGWPTYVATLRAAYERILPSERPRVVVFTGNYGEAGAIARYGRDLPPVFSGQNELYAEGPPPQNRDLVLAWTEDFADLSTHFDDCQRMATMDNGVGVDNEEQGSVVALCRVPSTGWAALWPSLQHYD